MKKKSATTLTPTVTAERSEELVGVLTAISVISRRLAKKLTILEKRSNEKEGETIDGSAGRISAHAD